MQYKVHPFQKCSIYWLMFTVSKNDLLGISLVSFVIGSFGVHHRLYLALSGLHFPALTLSG